VEACLVVVAAGVLALVAVAQMPAPIPVRATMSTANMRYPRRVLGLSRRLEPWTVFVPVDICATPDGNALPLPAGPCLGSICLVYY